MTQKGARQPGAHADNTLTETGGQTGRSPLIPDPVFSCQAPAVAIIPARFSNPLILLHFFSLSPLHFFLPKFADHFPLLAHNGSMMKTGTKPPQRPRLCEPPVAGDPGGTEGMRDQGREQRRSPGATAGNCERQQLKARSWKLKAALPPTPPAVLRDCETVKLWSLCNQWLAATVSQLHSFTDRFLSF